MSQESPSSFLKGDGEDGVLPGKLGEPPKNTNSHDLSWELCEFGN